MTERTITTFEGERRSQPRHAGDRWRTALTSIAPNSILIRGYPESRHGSLQLCILLLPFGGGHAAATGAHVRADDFFAAAADQLRLLGRRGLNGLRVLGSSCLRDCWQRQQQN